MRCFLIFLAIVVSVFLWQTHSEAFSTVWIDQEKWDKFEQQYFAEVKRRLNGSLPTGEHPYSIRVEAAKDGTVIGKPFITVSAGSKEKDHLIEEKIGAITFPAAPKVEPGLPGLLYYEMLIGFTRSGQVDTIRFDEGMLPEENFGSKGTNNIDSVQNLKSFDADQKDRMVKRYGKNDPIAAAACLSLAQTYRDIGDFQQSLINYKTARDIYANASKHIQHYAEDLYRCNEELAVAYLAVGDTAQAEQGERVVFETYPWELNHRFFRLSQFYERQGKLDASQKVLREGIAYQYRDGNILCYRLQAECGVELGNLLVRQKRQAEALDAFERSLQIIEKSFQPAHRGRLWWAMFDPYLELLHKIAPQREAAVAARLEKMATALQL